MWKRVNVPAPLRHGFADECGALLDAVATVADPDSGRHDRCHAHARGTDHLEPNTVSPDRRLRVLADERHR